MPIRELICPKHGKFERYLPSSPAAESDLDRYCVKCGATCKLVEFSVPAKRDPRYGIQS